MSTPRRSWASVSRCHQPSPTTSQLQSALVPRGSEQAFWKCLMGRRGTRASPLGQSWRWSLGARQQNSRAVACPMPPLPCPACSHLHRMQSPAPALARSHSCSLSPSRCQPSVGAMADPAWRVRTGTQTVRPRTNRLDMLARRPPWSHRPAAARKLYSGCKCLPANEASPSRPNTTREGKRVCCHAMPPQPRE